MSEHVWDGLLDEPAAVTGPVVDERRSGPVGPPAPRSPMDSEPPESSALGPPELVSASTPRWESRLRRALAAGDCLALAAAVALGRLAGSDLAYGLTLVVVALWLVSLWLHRVYDARHGNTGTAGMRRVVDASLRLGFVVVTVCYAGSIGSAREFVLVTFPVGLGLLLLGRLCARFVLNRLRRSGRCRQRVIAVGTIKDVVHFAEQVRSSPGAGLVVVGACTPVYSGRDRRADSNDRRASRSRALDAQEEGDRRAERDRRAEEEDLGRYGVEVVGGSHDVLGAVSQLQVDAVAVTGHGVLSRHALRRLAWQLEGAHVRLFVASALTDVAMPRISLRPVGGLPLLQVEAPTFAGGSRLFKGVLDRALAVIAVLVFSPLLIGLAVAIRLDSPGPVLFRQGRVGRGGRIFSCLKLRTMRVGADREVAELAAQNENDGVLFKMKMDPRVTRVGSVLRRLSLDELPQLFNVLGGSMSLVGPRPPLPEEVDQYGEDVRRRLLVKPGMTGLWQVSGRSDLSWAESVRLDLYYVENWSPLLDLTLMARTVTAVLKGRGAY